MPSNIFGKPPKDWTIDERIEFYTELGVPCNVWTGGYSESGSGYLSPVLGYNYKHIKVCRYLLEKKLGRPINPSLESCHTCTTSLCVTIDHLYEGSHLQNMRDRLLNGSYHYRKHPKEKYILAETLLRQGGISQKEIADKVGFEQSTISKMKQRLGMR